MARFELPSGQWIECRDQLNIKDRKAINHSLSMQVNEDNSRTMTGDVGDLMLGVLLERVITKWSLPIPVPSENDNKEVAEDHLSLQDWDFLMTETKPLLDQILKGGNKVDNPKK